MIRHIAPLRVAGIGILACINALFFLVLLGNITQDEEAIAPIQWSPNLTPFQDVSKASKTSGTYGQISAQPVFFKTRAPYVPPPPPPSPLPPQIIVPPPIVADPGFVLGGVVINRAGKKAYLFTKTNARGTWITEGESFMGWKLQTIEPTSTRLQLDSRSIELQLYVQR